ncbi:unnamed protein product, partial [Aureobasidium mustum]
PGGGARSGPPPPPPPGPPSRLTGANAVPTSSFNFGPPPTTSPSTNIFAAWASSGASNASVATGTKTAPTQPKTAATQTVTVLVGIFKQPFILHKGLLCFYSDFFRAALEGSFKEANEGKVELPDVQVEIFEAFQVWLYSRSLRNIEDDQSLPGGSKLPSFGDLARLWVFGDKYQIPLLQNCAIDALMDKHKEERRFSTDVVAIAYSETMVNSPLRRLAIEIQVHKMVHKVAENSIFRDSNLAYWTKEALVDFARGVSDAWERNLPKFVLPSREKCHYHVHATGDNCFRGIVTVEVGPQKQAFSIHKDLLCFYSDYFRGAFDGSFKEAVDGKIWLEKEDPAIFDIFNAFLYNRKLQNAKGLVGPSLSFRTLIDLWIFGDQFVVPLLQNLAVDSLKQKSDAEMIIPWRTEMRHVYDNTLHGAPLRRIMIDMTAYETRPGTKSREDYLEAWPVEALVDLAFTLSLKTAGEVKHLELPEYKKAKCYYHIHSEGEQCYREMPSYLVWESPPTITLAAQLFAFVVDILLRTTSSRFTIVSQASRSCATEIPATLPSCRLWSNPLRAQSTLPQHNLPQLLSQLLKPYPFHQRFLHGTFSSCHLLPDPHHSLLHRSCFQSIVTVEIGTGETAKVFHIHKDLLIFYSDYFRGAFNGSFIEATTGKISLADERVDVFDVVHQFIYTRQLSDEADASIDWKLLVRVWIFGDKHLMPCLQNVAVDMLMRTHEELNGIPCRLLKMIYKNTVSNSPLRKLMVDLTAYKVLNMDEFMRENDEERFWPYEALTDLVKTMGAKTKEDIGVRRLPEAKRHKCYYHIHAEGEMCL